MMKRLLAGTALLALAGCGNIQLTDGVPGEQCGGPLNYCATKLVWMGPRKDVHPFPGQVVFDEPAPTSTNSYAYLDGRKNCHLIIPFPDTVGYSKRFVRGLIAQELTNCNRLLDAGTREAQGRLPDFNRHTGNYVTETPAGAVVRPEYRQIAAARSHEWRWPDFGLDPKSQAGQWNQTLFEVGESDFIGVAGPRITPSRWR